MKKTTNETINLMEQANQFNFDKLAEFITEDDLKLRLNDLLLVYFEFTSLIIRHSEDTCSILKINGALYSMRLLYEALADMQNIDNASLKFTIK